MPLAPDHAFVDQLLTDRSHGLGIDTEGCRDVARLVGTGAELRHGAKVFLLKRGEFNRSSSLSL